MKIKVRNQAGIPNKYIRYIKWRIYRLEEKFKDLLFFDIYITKEGIKNSVYKVVLIVKSIGKNIVIKNNAKNLKMLWKKTLNDTQRYLRKQKEMNYNH